MLQVLDHKLSTTLTCVGHNTVVDELAQVQAELGQLKEERNIDHSKLSSVRLAIEIDMSRIEDCVQRKPAPITSHL